MAALNIAVLSDIHGNYISLQKCLEHAITRGADTFIFLGDYLGELAYPQKTMSALYSLKEKYKCFFIRGNKEDYWINYDSEQKGWSEYDSTTGSLYYTYNNLTQKDLRFFKALPIKKELIFEDLPDPSWVSRPLKRWIEAAGIKRRVTFHCFRHTFATLQIAGGTDLYTVSKMLGHTNVRTTQIYAKVIDKMKDEAANAINLDLNFNDIE